jgi:protein O-mannosyl-transferase
MSRPAAKPSPTPKIVRGKFAHPSVPLWFLAALLAFATTTVFWPATRYDFVNYDDDSYVTANAQVQKGLSLANVNWAFANPVAENWHPLTVLSHMAVCQFCGVNPLGHHLVNVLLHAANAALVFVWLWRLTGMHWRSFFVAALFAVHPLRVESVAWISERKDVLSAFFGLLALICYTRYAQARVWERNGNHFYKSPFYWLALFWFVLGLLSKPMLVTWPFVLLLLDFWPLGRVTVTRWRVRTAQFSTFNDLLIEKIPFFILAAAACAITLVVQQRSGALEMIGNLPLSARVGNALVSFCRYLGKLVWPEDLAVLYPHPGHWPVVEVVLAGGFLMMLSVYFTLQWHRHPFLLVGWLWFVGTLVPVIGLVQVGVQSTADRYTYLPSLGVLIIAVWSACEMLHRWRGRTILLTATGSILIILSIVLTRRQLPYWRDSETLFRHTLAVTENNYIAHYNLGVALDRKNQIYEATQQYQEALSLNPDCARAHVNLGADLDKSGETAAAIIHYQEAVRLAPDDVSAHNNLGLALFKFGRIEAAIQQYKEAIRLAPNNASIRNNLGAALNQQGATANAISQFQEALRQQPDYAEARFNLARILAKSGRVEDAIRQFEELLRHQPDYPGARFNFGVALAALGRTDQAIEQYSEAIRLNPDDAEAHCNLGNCLVKQGLADQAISQYQDAARLNPGNAYIRNNLGTALDMTGRTDEAINQFREAVRLDHDNLLARFNLANALMQKGQTEEAISQFQELISRKPDFTAARDRLAQLLENKSGQK